MKKLLVIVSALLVFVAIQGCTKTERLVTVVDMYAVNADGIGQQVGTVEAMDSLDGLVLKVDIKGLEGVKGGTHGFHVHVNPSCEATGPDGKKGAALAAGGHFDPDNTGVHLGPHGDGHMGDLPYVQSDVNGDIIVTVTAPRLKLSDIKDRSLMIHAGGDNYKDKPAVLGGGGGRIACGVVR